MKPEALIFRLEGVLCDIEVDYSRVTKFLKGKNGSGTFTVSATGPFHLISSDDHKMSSEEYKTLQDNVRKLVDDVEEEQVARASLLPGAKNGLASTQGMKLKVVMLTDLGEKATEKFLVEKELKPYFHAEATRNRIDVTEDLEKRIQRALKKLKVKPEECVFFCNTLADLRQAKLLKMMVVVLPSKKENANLLLQAKPDGMIISLEELPSLLSLDSWQSKKTPSTSSARPGKTSDL